MTHSSPTDDCLDGTDRTHLHHPSGARLYFPGWDTDTGALPPIAADAPTPVNRSLKMPRRRRTREADRAQRIRTHARPERHKLSAFASRPAPRTAA